MCAMGRLAWSVRACVGGGPVAPEAPVALRSHQDPAEESGPDLAAGAGTRSSGGA